MTKLEPKLQQHVDSFHHSVIGLECDPSLKPGEVLTILKAIRELLDNNINSIKVGNHDRSPFD